MSDGYYPEANYGYQQQPYSAYSSYQQQPQQHQYHGYAPHHHHHHGQQGQQPQPQMMGPQHHLPNVTVEAYDADVKSTVKFPLPMTVPSGATARYYEIWCQTHQPPHYANDRAKPKVCCGFSRLGSCRNGEACPDYHVMPETLGAEHNRIRQWLEEKELEFGQHRDSSYRVFYADLKEVISIPASALAFTRGLFLDPSEREKRPAALYGSSLSHKTLAIAQQAPTACGLFAVHPVNCKWGKWCNQAHVSSDWIESRRAQFEEWSANLLTHFHRLGDEVIFTVHDPQLRCILHVPKRSIKQFTRGLLQGNSEKCPSVCLLDQSERCTAGTRCNQAHVETTWLQGQRQAASEGRLPPPPPQGQVPNPASSFPPPPFRVEAPDGPSPQRGGHMGGGQQQQSAASRSASSNLMDAAQASSSATASAVAVPVPRSSSQTQIPQPAAANSSSTPLNPGAADFVLNPTARPFSIGAPLSPPPQPMPVTQPATEPHAANGNANNKHQEEHQQQHQQQQGRQQAMESTLGAGASTPQHASSTPPTAAVASSDRMPPASLASLACDERRTGTDTELTPIRKPTRLLSPNHQHQPGLPKMPSALHLKESSSNSGMGTRGSNDGTGAGGGYTLNLPQAPSTPIFTHTNTGGGNHSFSHRSLHGSGMMTTDSPIASLTFQMPPSPIMGYSGSGLAGNLLFDDVLPGGHFPPHHAAGPAPHGGGHHHPPQAGGQQRTPHMSYAGSGAVEQAQPTPPMGHAGSPPSPNREGTEVRMSPNGQPGYAYSPYGPLPPSPSRSSQPSQSSAPRGEREE